MATWITCKAGKKAKLQLLASQGSVTLILCSQALTCTSSSGQGAIGL